MSCTNPATILIGVALVVFLIGRQFTPQPVKEGRLWLFPLALTVYGIYEMSQTPPSSVVDIAMLAVSVVTGAVLGFGRGMSMRLLRTSTGQLMQQGTLLTVGLWVLSVALRIGLGFLAHGAFDTNELPLFLGITFGAQALAVLLRTGATSPRSSDAYSEPSVRY